MKLAVLLLAIAAVAQPQTPPSEPNRPQQNVAEGTPYVIAPSDRISVRVSNLPEMSTLYDINRDGNVVMPIIRSVRAAGLTEKQLEESIAARLKQIGVLNATVTVSVRKINKATDEPEDVPLLPLKLLKN